MEIICYFLNTICMRGIYVNRVTGWISSLFILSGALYTIYYFNNLLEEKQELYEQSTGFVKLFYGASHSIDEALFSIPITIGSLLAIIGIITLWERDVFFAYLSVFLAIFSLNLIGSLLSLIGTIIGFVVWRKQS